MTALDAASAGAGPEAGVPGAAQGGVRPWTESCAWGWLAMVGFLLCGYAFFNRSFAHLGVFPLYIGDITLLAGFLTLLVGGASLSVFRSPIVAALVLFLAWGAVTTFPHVGRYGMDSFRDGVAWAYGVMALLVAGALLKVDGVPALLSWYRAWFPWFLVWASPALIAFIMLGASMPTIPGTTVMLIEVKGGDLGVHMAAAAGFLYLGLLRLFPAHRLFNERTLWLIWGIDFFVVGARSRGGLLSILVALGVICLFRPSARLFRVAGALALVVLIFLGVGSGVDLGDERSLGPQQIANNIASVIDHNDADISLSGTAAFRLRWWNTIIDYAVFGDHAALGKGYGVNLANDDGFQILADGSLRSPHNAHLTFLARSGIPGLAIWALLLLVIGGTLVAGFLRNRRLGRQTLADLYLWVLSVWVSCLVNMTFDVYLEGPHGGLWFWSIVGFAIALREAERRTAEHGRIRLA